MEENWNIILSILESPDPKQIGYQKVLTSTPIRIGRAEDNDFVLNDPAVSRNHVILRLTNDYSRVFITDTSTHGTTVSGRQVPKGLGFGFTVQNGESIRMGNSLVRFELNLKQSVQPTLITTIDRSFLEKPDSVVPEQPQVTVEESEPELPTVVKKTRKTSTFSIVTIIICLLILIYLVFFQ